MNELSPKERLLGVLSGHKTDRSPVICPGGMMNAAVVEVQRVSGEWLPDAHGDTRRMVRLAREIQRQTGFENYGIPFCMTIEPEALGSEIDIGDAACEPKIVREAYANVSEVDFRDIRALLEDDRVGVLSGAIETLRGADGDVPVIGSLSVPISTAASVVEPMPFLKALRKDPSGAHRVLDYVTDFLIAYAGRMLDCGADVITIADPTATGEILGPRFFESYAVLYINRIIDALHARGAKVILHICGDLGPVWSRIPRFRSDAISTDATVSLRRLKADFPQLTTMGNLSTYLLEFADADKVSDRAAELVQQGIGILAPACGLSTSSSVANLRAFTDTVRK